MELRDVGRRNNTICFNWLFRAYSVYNNMILKDSKAMPSVGAGCDYICIVKFQTKRSLVYVFFVAPQNVLNSGTFLPLSDLIANRRFRMRCHVMICGSDSLLQRICRHEKLI